MTNKTTSQLEGSHGRALPKDPTSQSSFYRGKATSYTVRKHCVVINISSTDNNKHSSTDHPNPNNFMFQKQSPISSGLATLSVIIIE